MLVDYEVTKMGCFDDYSDAAPRAKTMRRNGITTFLLHVSQCITFRQTNIVTGTLIAKAFLKSFYSRLGFKVITYFATSRRLVSNLIMIQENLKHFRKKNWITMSSKIPKTCYNYS